MGSIRQKTRLKIKFEENFEPYEDLPLSPRLGKYEGSYDGDISPENLIPDFKISKDGWGKCERYPSGSDSTNYEWNDNYGNNIYLCCSDKRGEKSYVSWGGRFLAVGCNGYQPWVSTNDIILIKDNKSDFFDIKRPNPYDPVDLVDDLVKLARRFLSSN